MLRLEAERRNRFVPARVAQRDNLGGRTAPIPAARSDAGTSNSIVFCIISKI
ncbi:hypothetical protein JW877_09490 [bacterium]|nr:hypothetical protein [bacterium]